MKKVLSFIVFALAGLILTGGILILARYQKNPLEIVPYPYQFAGQASALQLDAPILIAGDDMGEYMAKFSSELAATISTDLSSPIKIQSMAQKGQGLHRTLHNLKALTQWPQILVYQGASEEFRESKFELSEAPTIKKNFKLYKNENVETALVLYPWLSRLIYDPIKRVVLEEEPQFIEGMDEDEYLQRLETELLLYEQQLIQLVNMSKDKNTLLILTTTPINFDISPKKVCEFTSTIEIDQEIADLRELLKVNDPKSAYSRSSKIVEQNSGNALLYFIHGQICKRLGKMEEARESLKKASAYDCSPWRVTEVHNSIIRKIAHSHQVLLFDFALLIEGDWSLNPTFFDEVHPQNLYYEQGMQQLGLVIKKILKL